MKTISMGSLLKGSPDQFDVDLIQGAQAFYEKAGKVAGLKSRCKGSRDVFWVMT